MQPVFILGAGINGAALARELVLSGVGVWIVDTADIASGATAYSSRLIHGGLRYLEYGELGLVRESLAERTRLLRLAPQYVRPLRLFIPVERRWGGWSAAIRRFLRRAPRLGSRRAETSRGLWLVRVGLWLYDRFARDPLLPRRATYPADDARAPPVDVRRFRYQCAYSDAAIEFPERFVVALLEDARREAERQGIEFRVLTYHRARFVHESSGPSSSSGKTVEVAPVDGPTSADAPLRLEPSAIVNATGAWVDHTLQSLRVESRRLIGGTKGSHVITSHTGLRAALAGRGVYTEAADGRPVFLLPLGENSLVGTTDLPFLGDPATATASDAELDYLLAAANRVFPQLRLARRDIDWHYSGVRPLPFVDASSPAAITRRHWLAENTACPVPLYSVIGGKLTTCRSLAEEAADVILRRLERPRTGNSRDRILPGGEDYPLDGVALRAEHARLAEQCGLPVASIAAVWRLFGTRTESVLQACGDVRELLAGTPLPRALVRWVIEHEWVHDLDDLICRRLMLLHAPLQMATVEDLTQQLVACGRLTASQSEEAVASALARLAARFAKHTRGCLTTPDRDA